MDKPTTWVERMDSSHSDFLGQIGVSDDKRAFAWSNYHVTRFALDELLSEDGTYAMAQLVGDQYLGKMVESIAEEAILLWRYANIKEDGSLPGIIVTHAARILMIEIERYQEAIYTLTSSPAEMYSLLIASLASNKKMGQEIFMERWYPIVRAYSTRVILPVLDNGGSLESLEKFHQNGLDSDILLSFTTSNRS